MRSKKRLSHKKNAIVISLDIIQCPMVFFKLLSIFLQKIITCNSYDCPNLQYCIYNLFNDSGITRRQNGINLSDNKCICYSEIVYLSNPWNY